jgi:hypothetical protein
MCVRRFEVRGAADRRAVEMTGVGGGLVGGQGAAGGGYRASTPSSVHFHSYYVNNRQPIPNGSRYRNVLSQACSSGGESRRRW